MQNFTSPEALREICSVFELEARRLGSGLDILGNSAASDSDAPISRAHAASRPEPSFATLAATFINSLALGPPLDLGKDWLLHRLHCILVNHEIPMPGEIEVMRADIRARLEASIFSSNDADLFMSGVDRVLQGFTLWPVHETGRVRSEPTGSVVSP